MKWTIEVDVLDTGGLVVTVDPHLEQGKAAMVTAPMRIRFEPEESLGIARRIERAQRATSVAPEARIAALEAALRPFAEAHQKAADSTRHYPGDFPPREDFERAHELLRGPSCSS
jgi:hypothetical protein